jgi:hypothetical protein
MRLPRHVFMLAEHEGELSMVGLTPDHTQYVTLDEFNRVVLEYEAAIAREITSGRADANREMSRMMVEKRLREQIAADLDQFPKGSPGAAIKEKLLAILDSEPPLEFNKPQEYSPITPGPKHIEPVAQGQFHNYGEVVGVNMYPKQDDTVIRENVTGD